MRAELADLNQCAVPFFNFTAWIFHLTYSNFRLFDKNGDGKLSKNEIRHILNSSEDFDIDSSDLDNFFAQVDADNNGYIDYYEFIRCIS